MGDEPRQAPHPDDAEPAGRSMASALWRGASAGILAVLVLVAVLVAGVPLVTGASAFTISGRSMEPALPLGTLIVIQPVEPAEIVVGDIITYQLEPGEPTVATHRVVGFGFTAEGRAFVTQGDANDGIDAEPVRAEQIRGRLWYSIPMLGWVNAAVSGPARAFVLPVVVAGLFGYAGWMLVSAARDRRAGRGARRQAEARSTEDDGSSGAMP
ncbi:signal peptidase I [Microbacterium paludicola]|uniref:signal peptidase I n=1 Tax=Microbacterium paludicola TaxID=300019 RepID=UPI0011A8B65E|nr:signal peptidase I [Microbacterium paludicola]